MTSGPPIRIGTRGSKLARWQADWVAARLQAHGCEVEIVTISTRGDQQTIGPIGTLGGTGVFTKEIQRALLDREVDLAVHSLKDLPTEPVPGLALAAVPPRERCGDVLIAREAKSLQDLAAHSTVGTGSLRRQAQLKYVRPDLVVQDIRGNVETRLQKLDDGQYDAIVLAEAGLLRLGLEDRIVSVLPKDQVLPAVGQGALGLETRQDDPATRAALVALDDRAAHAAVIAERALLATLRGGCLAPVGAWGRLKEDGELQLDAVVLDRDGTRRLLVNVSGAVDSAQDLGTQAAQQLLEQGAAELIACSRSNG